MRAARGRAGGRRPGGRSVDGDPAASVDPTPRVPSAASPARRPLLLIGALLLASAPLAACDGSGPDPEPSSSTASTSASDGGSGLPAPTAGAVSDGGADAARTEGASDYASTPDPSAPVFEDAFSPQTAAQPGSYTQETDLWSLYADAGSTRYDEDPAVRGALPEDALRLGAGSGPFTTAFGNVISDTESSATRLRAALGDRPITPDLAIPEGVIVNRYPDSVHIETRVADGALYVYAVSKDSDHLISYTARV